MFRRGFFRMTALFRRADVEADFDEEVRYHFDREVERHVAGGMSHAEAVREARRRYGNAAILKEDARATWRWRRLDDLARDVGFALRMLRRAPGFTAVVVATLALGIGANTAVFSVVRSVLLRPLPFPEEERLAVLLMRAPNFNMEDAPSSPPEYAVYRDQTRSWEQLAAYRLQSATVAESGQEAERLVVALASSNLFGTLRAQPALGRLFTPQEDREGSGNVAVLSHGFWMSRYGGDPGVIGKTVRLDGIPRTVVGVMPATFGFPSRDVRLWVPLALTSEQLQRRGSHNLSIVGRLRGGVSLDAAEREVTALVSRLIEQRANFHEWHPVYLRSLRTDIIGDVSHPLWVMMGAVALVLVIACANVANLLLVRAASRAREMSLRSALGAGRRRLVSQLLTESLVLAAAGGLAGVALAYLGVESLGRIAPANLPRLDEIQVDTTVLAITSILTLGAGVLFGLAPALQASRANIQGMLGEEGKGGTAGRKHVRLRDILVASETALAVVLLVGAGLLLQSFQRLMAVDPGFRAQGVFTGRVSLPGVSYPDDQDVVSYYERLLSQVARVPGVAAAGAVSVVPLTGAAGPSDVEVEGWTGLPDAPRPTADVQAVTPGYFAAMRIPVRAGRLFEAGDRADAPLVAVVSETLARDYWRGRSALGGRIRLDGDDERFAQVVGIVPDVRQESLASPTPRGTLYLAHAQTPLTWSVPLSMSLTVRTGVEPASVTGAIRRVVHEIDPSVPLYQVRTMDEVIAGTTETQRFSMLLQLSFAGVALLLAMLGLYGMLAFSVARRTREIGIRMALGAERSGVRRMVVAQGLRVVTFGLAAGILGAIAAGQLLESLLYGVSSTDPVTFATVVGALLAAALVACWIPARRASGVDPAVALRAE
jgi:putative ABC transport system permease protein